MHNGFIFPSALAKGDTVGIISPASPVKKEYIEGLCASLGKAGYDAIVAHSAACAPNGSYAASLHDRLKDIIAMLSDSRIKAIFCSRGGYGAAQLLPYIPAAILRANPKWLIGFSDISALHSFWLSQGVASVHGPMAKHFAELGNGDRCSAALLSILAGALPRYSVEPHQYNNTGTAEGYLKGGNLAVLDGLASTPFDLLSCQSCKDSIIFIEDIAEPIYKIDRMLWRLYMSGTLSAAKGLIIGQFTEYNPDRNFNSMEEMIRGRLTLWGLDIPVAFNFPCGHTDYNLPLVEGSYARLSVGDSNVSLKMSRGK